ncbi:MAG TPA: hypothetical protein PLT93_11940, partial [Phycisphaerae bacterium]|nr:hypothetical protein [Phycisphaerae bacterium]
LHVDTRWKFREMYTFRDRGDRTLLATFFDGHIRFGTVDWRADTPTARLIASADELREWQ